MAFVQLRSRGQVSPFSPERPHDSGDTPSAARLASPSVGAMSNSLGRSPPRAISPAANYVPLPAFQPPKVLRARRKKRVSNTEKLRICRLHKYQPHLTQRDIAERFAIERSTVSKILKEKDRWSSVPDTDVRTVYRLRYAFIIYYIIQVFMPPITQRDKIP